MAASILPLDMLLADDVRFDIGQSDPIRILFQFPPKVSTDSRTGTWEEVEIPGDQPVSIWKTSGARKIALEWTYVVGATASWGVDKVRKQIRQLRNYYTMRENLGTNYVVNFRLWKFGGNETLTCRLGNIDISHGKAMYVPLIGGVPDVRSAHPVVTNVKVAIQPWTKGNANFGMQAKTAGAAAAGEKANALLGKIELKLASSIPIEWE